MCQVNLSVSTQPRGRRKRAEDKTRAVCEVGLEHEMTLWVSMEATAGTPRTATTALSMSMSNNVHARVDTHSAVED